MVGLSVWQGYIYMWRGTVGDSLGDAPTLCTVYGGWGRVERPSGTMPLRVPGAWCQKTSPLYPIHHTQHTAWGQPQTVANCPRLHKTRPTGYIGPLGPPCTEGKIPHLSLSSARHSATATPPLCPIHHTQYTEWGHPPNCHQLSHAHIYIALPDR